MAELKTSIDGAVATVIFSNPPKMNAMSYDMWQAVPKVFAELQNAQAIVLPYDGLNPQPPTYCYLKPHYLDVKTSYFDHVANGVL